MRRFWFVVAVAIVVAFGAVSPFAQQQATDDKTVWNLEHSYWDFVKALDLESYKKLWHPNFVGWPSVSPRPARKDHITDWITSHSEKGERLQSFTLVEADSQATENVVVTHYWLTTAWSGKDGAGKPATIRVTHTWIRTASGWQIIGGMSAPEPNPVP